MLAHTLMMLLLLPVPADDTLPGDVFVQVPEETVLRAGPSGHHVGVLTLGAAAVLRRATPDVQAPAPAWVAVYVPQGFPVYVHADFVEIDEGEHRALVVGTRVNLRLLPAAVGLPPVGQLPEGVPPPALQLLDVEGEWVRVLAPIDLPLYAAAETLAPAEAGAEERWTQLVGTRWARRQQAVAAFEATDPAMLRQRELGTRAGQLTAVDLLGLDDGGLLAHREQLQALLVDLPAGESRISVETAVEAVDREQTRRSTASATLAEVERARAREAAELVREARALDFGLRFEGKGEPLTIEGLVSRRSSEQSEAAVYCIQDAAGRTFKLSAAKSIADLPALLGKNVLIAGRTLLLVNVDGPVLIVDKASPAARR